MRFATVFDRDNNEAVPVFELPGGQRVELRELFRPHGAETLTDEALGEMPMFFTDLAKTVEFLDDVVDAIRQWSRERAESWREPQGEAITSRTDAMPFLPPVPVVRNLREFDAFEQHAKIWRARVGRTMPDDWTDVPRFTYGCAGSIVGHQAAVHAPRDCEELDYGLQIAAVIGRGGRNIRAADAWRHIAGFTILNSFVSRDIERQELALGLGRCKSRDFATAIGPYLVPMSSLRDRIDADDRLHLVMRALVNGNELSRADASAMHFTWPRLIEQASRESQLYPGDVIGGGVVGSGSILDLGGQPAANYLRPGDVVELEVERLGTLRTPIVAGPTNGSAVSSVVLATASRAPQSV